MKTIAQLKQEIEETTDAEIAALDRESAAGAPSSPRQLYRYRSFGIEELAEMLRRLDDNCRYDGQVGVDGGPYGIHDLYSALAAMINRVSSMAPKSLEYDVALLAIGAAGSCISEGWDFEKRAEYEEKKLRRRQ